MPANNQEQFFGPWIKNDSISQIQTSGFSNGSSNNSKRTSPIISRHNSPTVGSPSTSPPHIHSPLRRNLSNPFMIIPEDREIDIIPNRPKPIERYVPPPKKRVSWKIKLITLISWPILLTGLCLNFLLFPIKVLFTPTFWLTMVVQIIWKIVAAPIMSIKRFLILLNTPLSERNRKKRTILISCGSTIQSLHLARNFHSAGARVVVFEFQGLFQLAKFSTAVDKFYTIPRVTPYNLNDYVAALCDIVAKEKPTLYVPVCSSNPAYYDTFARPHLELLGCKSFIPGAQEIMVLDNVLEILRNCEGNQIPTPLYRIVRSREDLNNLYESGWFSNYRCNMTSVGFNGVIERNKIILPRNRQDLRLTHEISEEKPWIVLQDLPGKNYVTCTTVKESQVVANVTCSVVNGSQNFIPELNEEVDRWLENFFSKVRFPRPINGHFSFRFVKTDRSNELLPLGARVGVSLPYICYTSVQSKILCKPCPHFKRHTSGPVVQTREWYKLPEMVLNVFRNPSKKSLENFIGTVIDKREALFVYWDFLPYLAFYHFQILKSITHYIKKRRNSCKHMPVH